MNENFLDENNLPLANPNEELENISRNLFNPLFDVQKFELRPESIRDKGIDYHIELKKNGRFTNFRFLIQLKATDAQIPNLDGSISIQIYTYNINYLINSGQLAFYVLFSVERQKFYFESLNDFVRDISKKEKSWLDQKTHVLRFKNQLDLTQIDAIYEKCFQFGLFQRSIFEKMAFRLPSFSKNEKVHIDRELNVSDDVEIMDFVEKAGSILINKGEWSRVLELHDYTSRGLVSSAIYDFTVGLAYYYAGQYLHSLTFFRSASRKREKLPTEFLGHLTYFQLSAEYSLGIIEKPEYNNKLEHIEGSEGIGSYVKLERIKEEYQNQLTIDPEESLLNFKNEIREIVNSELSDGNLKLIARGESMLIEGGHNNMVLLQNLFRIKGIEESTGANVELRTLVLAEFLQAKKTWESSWKVLVTDAADSKNYFAFYLASFHFVKVLYEELVYSNVVPLEFETSSKSKEDVINDLLKKLNEIYEFYKRVKHVENQCAVLVAKYELSHFSGEFDQTSEVIQELESLINVFDLSTIKTKVNELQNGGTLHEKLNEQINNTIKEIDAGRVEYEGLVEEMQKMDALENQQSINTPNKHIVELFPIGQFSFPEEDTGFVFEILKLSETAINQVENILDLGVIPVLNILNNPILNEGLGSGMEEVIGIESWRNVYRIRKEFFERGYSRTGR